MIKSASDLRSMARNKKYINIEIREILKAMEMKMIDANKDGRCSIFFDVPKNYSTVGSDFDSTIAIITGVISELKKCGYRVQISDRRAIYVFRIEWAVVITESDRAEMMKTIHRHTVD